METLARKLRRFFESTSFQKPEAPAILLEMTQALGGVVSRDELSSLLVRRAPEILEARQAALLLPRHETDLALVEANGWSLAGEELPGIPRRGRLATILLQASKPVAAPELRSAGGWSAFSEGERWWLERPEAELWVPLVRRGAYGRYIMGKLEGILLLGPRGQDAGFSTEQRRVLHALSFAAAVAAENVELVEALRRKAAEVNHLYGRVLSSREEERKRIARELHDSITQDLIDLLFRLEEPELRAITQETGLRARIREVIDRTRRLCAELRPPALDDLDLPHAMRGYLEEFRENFGLDASLTVEPEDGDPAESVPEEARVCLFRVLQEAMTNVQRHAAATRVEVSLRDCEDELVLEIHDDGRGFDRPPRLSALVHEGRFGLAGAQERVNLLGGTLEVESRRGSGTHLSARLPRRPPPGVPSESE